MPRFLILIGSNKKTFANFSRFQVLWTELTENDIMFNLFLVIPNRQQKNSARKA